MKKKIRRFGVHEVKKGPYKGSLHRATQKYMLFSSELYYLSGYLDRRILPSEPEEVAMRGIIENIQNILEHEVEDAIKFYIEDGLGKKDSYFLKSINEGKVSFRSKFDWLLSKKLISTNTWKKLEQIRVLRNNFVHRRPTNKRIKFKYFNELLMTTRTLRKLFSDAEAIRKHLLEITRNKKGKWPLIPPGYARELNWGKEC